MAEVKWQARRVSDSVLVDVTADVDGSVAIAPTANAIEGGGLSNPVTEPLTVTSIEPDVLLVVGDTAENSVDLFRIKPSNGDMFYGQTSGNGWWKLLQEGVHFDFRREGGSLSGDIATFSEYGSNLISNEGSSIIYADRETVGGGLAFFEVPPVGQQAAIADATDPASTMARLNDLLAALRAYGLLDT